MKTDWIGDTNSIFKTLGSSHHSEREREHNDYYATDPLAARFLLELENFAANIWEPACGEGHLSKVLESSGYSVKSTDLVDRGYGEGGLDFLSIENHLWDGDIITNPPYKYAQEFIEKAIAIIPYGNKVAMFLKLTFLEGKGRRDLFRNNPPARIWVSSSRINCALNGDFERQRMTGGSAVAYAWYVWEKGYKGSPKLGWFN